MGQLRVFTALPLPAEAVRRLSGACAGLRSGFPGLRVVREEALHVTLQFYGELPEDTVRQLAEHLPAAVAEGRGPEAGSSGIRATLGGLGQFPPSGAPRVLYCPVGAGSEEVAALHARLRDALRQSCRMEGEAGQEDGRPFTAHVTVARSRGGIVDVAAARRLFAFELPIELDRVVLFQSILGRQGAEYRPLASAAFV